MRTSCFGSQVFYLFLVLLRSSTSRGSTLCLAPNTLNKQNILSSRLRACGQSTWGIQTLAAHTFAKCSLPLNVWSPEVQTGPRPCPPVPGTTSISRLCAKPIFFVKLNAVGEKRTLTVGKSLDSVKKLWVAVRSIATITQSFHNAGLLCCWGKVAEKPLPSNPNHLTNVVGVLPMQTSAPFEPGIHETLNAHAFQTHFSKSEYLLVFVWSPSGLLRPRPWGQCVPGTKSTSKLGRLTKWSHWGCNDKRASAFPFS